MSKFGIRCSLLLFAIGSCLVISQTLEAGGFGLRRSVGGISIDTNGILRTSTVADAKKLRQFMEGNLDQINGDLKKTTKIRKISLKQLENVISSAANKDIDQLPDEVKYLGGLQRIQYIWVFPEQNDVVLAGPAEGWKIDRHGNVVGVGTGRPVVLLEDLVVAMKSVDAARQGGISVSIDPTAEGRRNFDRYMKKQRVFSKNVLGGIEKALGPQQITIQGVPETSHFSRVLVAADYRMKRIAMHLDPSPVKDIDSYLTMMKKRRAKQTDLMPRWWLATDYEPLAKSADGLAWELRGQGVKAMTEDEIIHADGSVQGTGKANPIAQEWADNMTAHYQELCEKDSVFGQLRNVMDLCVVAAVIKNEGLLETAGLILQHVSGASDEVSIHTFNPPKTVDTQCSFIKKGRNYIITASGGVMIESWQAATKSQTSRHVEKVRASNGHQATSNIWWN